MFTSTVNVAFWGQEVINGQEPDYSHLEEESANVSHLDTYSRCKASAERIVAAASTSCRPVVGHQNSWRLKTCILRYFCTVSKHSSTRFPHLPLVYLKKLLKNLHVNSQLVYRGDASIPSKFDMRRQILML